jgi:DNA-binding MarR family transcriptional regulator
MAVAVRWRAAPWAGAWAEICTKILDKDLDKDLHKDFDIREFRSCSCLRLRRVAREATRVYDGYLESTGLGANQLILLTMLHGAEEQHREGVTAKALAQHFGADPTTLSRNLKPLLKRGLISARVDPADRRSRLLRITAKGEAKLREAGPHWRKAEARMKAAVGAARLRSLHDLLDRVAAAFQA